MIELIHIADYGMIHIHLHLNVGHIYEILEESFSATGRVESKKGRYSNDSNEPNSIWRWISRMLNIVSKANDLPILVYLLGVPLTKSKQIETIGNALYIGTVQCDRRI